MKKANNNEIELLLRSLGRSGRNGSSLSNGTKSIATDHLDADELNTFAEGLVPEATRARYVKHLADCANCRGIVVNLAQASGIANRSVVPDSETKPQLWPALMAFLSTPFLKYALPVIALSGLIGLTFLVLRRDNRGDIVAGNYGTPATTMSDSSVPTPAATPINQASEVPSSLAGSKASTPEPRQPVSPQANRNEPAKPTDTDFVEKTVKSVPPPPPAALETGKSQPVFAPEPKSGALASAPTVGGSTVATKTEAVKEEQTSDRVAQQRERDALRNNEFTKEGEDKASGMYKVSPSGPRRSEAPATEGRVYAAKNKKDSVDEEETRSVSGRHFRRQGNVWVDTSYEVPRATINVARGSEQFRALIADEPGIGAVANQLAGDVIVVWKGKAYRIR